jgi:hypothetical protein
MNARQLISAAAVVGAFTVPATASASKLTVASVTRYVAKGYAQQIEARAKMAGDTFDGTTMRCAAISRGRFTCYGTYTVTVQGTHVKDGQFINVKADGSWFTQGNGTLLKEW